MDAFGLIADFAQGTSYVVSRQTRGPFTKGRYIQGSITIFTITASVQPTMGRDLDRLPEGRRTKATKTIFTTTPLQVGGQDSAMQADTISIEGVSWEIQHSEIWGQPGEMATYYKCLAQSAAV